MMTRCCVPGSEGIQGDEKLRSGLAAYLRAQVMTYRLVHFQFPSLEFALVLHDTRTVQD